MTTQEQLIDSITELYATQSENEDKEKQQRQTLVLQQLMQIRDQINIDNKSKSPIINKEIFINGTIDKNIRQIQKFMNFNNKNRAFNKKIRDNQNKMYNNEKLFNFNSKITKKHLSKILEKVESVDNKSIFSDVELQYIKKIQNNKFLWDLTVSKNKEFVEKLKTYFEISDDDQLYQTILKFNLPSL